MAHIRIVTLVKLTISQAQEIEETHDLSIQSVLLAMNRFQPQLTSTSIRHNEISATFCRYSKTIICNTALQPSNQDHTS